MTTSAVTHSTLPTPLWLPSQLAIIPGTLTKRNPLMPSLISANAVASRHHVAIHPVPAATIPPATKTAAPASQPLMIGHRGLTNSSAPSGIPNCGL